MSRAGMSKLGIAGIVVVDPSTNLVAVVLDVVGEDRVFPLWAGAFEANAIGLEMEHVKVPRPMTHDLMKEAILAMGGDVTHVALTDLRENTFFATIFIDHDDDEIRLDARPSDAMALALRCAAPIFVADEVLGRLSTFDSHESLLRYLEGKDP